MKFLHWIAAGAMALCQSSALAQKQDPTWLIASNGKAACTIVLGSDATAPERHAAKELRHYLSKVTGATFPLVDLAEKEQAVEGQQILIGATREVRERLPEVNWEQLGKDGLLLETKGDTLILAGGRPRGTLYAVYEFLEKYAGCRWWTPTEGTFPQHKELAIGPIAYQSLPAFDYREYFSSDTVNQPEFATRLRLNGEHQRQPPEWGGHYTLLGFVHTFSELLPPERFFKEHPHWYTDQANGNRPSHPGSALPEGQQTQLCLSNPEVIKALTKEALAWIKKNPKAGYISISQNDNSNYCQCSECAQRAVQEGSESGSIIRAVNAVAGEIGKAYPDFRVETLAYTYSEKPPRHVRPAENVVIRLALALADYGHPMESRWNRAAADLIAAWGEISHELFVWSYAANFKRAILPHPNWSGAASDLQFFSKSKVRGMFVQGNKYSGPVGDFNHLRSWLWSRLLWNPQQDQQALREEFLNGYYGAAAGPILGEYLDLVTNAFLAQERGLNTNNQDLSFLNLEVITRGEALFTRAKEAVKGDATLTRRIERDELSLLLARLARDRALRAEAKAKQLPYPSPEEIAQRRKAFEEAAREHGVELWGENIPFETGLAEMDRTLQRPQVALPPGLDTQDREVIDFQPSMLTLAFRDILSEIREDEAASGKEAVVIKTASDAWLVQAQLGPHLDQSGKTWRLYAVIKAEGAQPEATAILEGGVYDDSNASHEGRFTIPYEQLAGEEYQLLELGRYRLTPGMTVWFAPMGGESADAIRFDRVILVAE